MPRYATTEQIEQVENLESNINAYQTLIDDVVKSIAGFIEAYELTFTEAERAEIETRYITSEGRDDEQWRGHLVSASRKRNSVNLWLITITTSQGLPFGNGESMGSFDKQFSFGVDYYYDYNFGTDDNNSEAFFNKKVDGIDFIFEQIRTCLPHNAEMQSWIFRRLIKRFTNASSHIAKGDVAVKISGL